MKRYHTVLTIAGSDSGGGAGIQADLKTISALGCYGHSVITALTAQNTVGVWGIHPVPSDFVRQQLEAVLSDIGADCVKIGMLFSAGIVDAVAETLQKFQIRSVVLDPVMISTSGNYLLETDAIDRLKTKLFPLTTVLTPNLAEAEALVGRHIRTIADMEAAARQLAQLGCQAVLVKGGHLEAEQSTDVLYESFSGQLSHYSAPRIETNNTHGTGCTLSSAIAAYLAQGLELAPAIGEAKTYLQQALQQGQAYRLGQGYGPVHHFHRWWNNK
jgi:hydroxymethylpyrimidine/phosphomethylpyrimidine kinase